MERTTADMPRINEILPAIVLPFGLHGVSFVHFSEEAFGTVVFDGLEALKSKEDVCVLGEPTRCPFASRPARLRSG